MNSSSDPEPFYLDGAFYDQLHFDQRDDRDFYLRQARGSVLELACGTGRLAIPLAEAGHSVVGLDRSPSMLVQAASKSAAVEWVKGDFREFSLGRRFDTVIIGFNSLQHCLTANDVRAVFACAQQHLAPGGRFVFDVFLPDVVKLASAPGTGRAEFSDLSAPVSVEFVRYDALAQVVHHAFVVGEQRAELQLRCFFPQELAALVESAGWRTVQRFGDFDESPLQSASPKQIYVCQRTEAASPRFGRNSAG